MLTFSLPLRKHKRKWKLGELLKQPAEYKLTERTFKVAALVIYEPELR